ncbi:hypothetical protein D2Q93_08670 [Alicyclobacillaceae bacterium I2511]|nr:hypothetical protein D2Q93_08670 [Alicyclobacillaceae bacterium I2511]
MDSTIFPSLDPMQFKKGIQSSTPDIFITQTMVESMGLKPEFTLSGMAPLLHLIINNFQVAIQAQNQTVKEPLNTNGMFKDSHSGGE